MIMPPQAHGVKVISIGMFTPGNAAVVWRGPMLHRALQQFLADVYWGDLDVLLLDLPPGTGDVAISLAQLLPNAEILVVTTPQAAAAEVAERAGAIALQTHQRLVGVVENMSWLELPDGARMEVFGSGGGAAVAESLTRTIGAQVPLLGQIPLDTRVREAGDAGTPIVLADAGRAGREGAARRWPTGWRYAGSRWSASRWASSPPAADRTPDHTPHPRPHAAPPTTRRTPDHTPHPRPHAAPPTTRRTPDHTPHPRPHAAPPTTRRAPTTMVRRDPRTPPPDVINSCEPMMRYPEQGIPHHRLIDGSRPSHPRDGAVPAGRATPLRPARPGGRGSGGGGGGRGGSVVDRGRAVGRADPGQVASS